jgi:magnesium-transporting ATPase (P-type)
VKSGLQNSIKPAAFYASNSSEFILAALESRLSGLAPAEIRLRLIQYGANALPCPVRRPWYLQLASNFVHLFALLLWVGAFLAWLAGMPQLCWAIVVVILINGVFSYWQEYQAERAAEALQALLPQQVMVRREGEEQLIPASEVVPGDILLLAEGAAIPADARVLLAERLRVDMSSLTGESKAVPRTAHEAKTVPPVSTAGLPNLVFAGTNVVSGRGEAVVFATGANTEFGRIAQITQEQTEQQSPLQKELSSVTRIVTLLAVGMGVVCFIAGTMLGGLSRLSAFVFAVGIIVANVPEGLLPTLTLSLALGVRRMAGRKALIKRLSAVETLGAATVILTDKTGTLTENEMTVRDLWTSGLDYHVGGLGYETSGKLERVGNNTDDTFAQELLRIAALCSDAHLVRQQGPRRHFNVIGDPTEAAILVAAAKAGISQDALKSSPRLAELPFDSVRKRMTTIQQIEASPVACVKGAPSELFPRCSFIQWQGATASLDESRLRLAREAHDKMAERGLRVLAVATRRLENEQQGNGSWRVEDVEDHLTLLGLIGMEDPPRPEVPAAIAACRRAGIRVLMITGDDGLTATAISREIGLNGSTPLVVSGADLESFDDQDLAGLMQHSEVLFARVSPEHKLRLVDVLQKQGEVVAVTGDGVNDAPALKRADIGVAMGATGTDVAREAADMVLADDNFASIVAAVEEGRAVYDNVRKFVTYIFASNIPEMAPFIAYVLFHLPLPLTVMQILAVDLGTDLLPALALGSERPQGGVMNRPPRRRGERLLNLPTLLRGYAWLGMLEAVLSLSGYLIVLWLAGWRPGMPLESSNPLYMMATTMTLAGIVACQVGNAFACRSDTESIWRLGFTTNRMLLAALLIEILLLLTLIYALPLQTVFGLAPLAPVHWLLLLTFGPLLLLLEECRKALRRRLAIAPINKNNFQDKRV